MASNSLLLGKLFPRIMKSLWVNFRGIHEGGSISCDSLDDFWFTLLERSISGFKAMLRE